MTAANEWAEQQWGSAELGDQRRTKRAVRMGGQIAANPQGSLPAQTQCWRDLKGAYRLLDNEAVTHAALSRPHWQLTRQAATRSPVPVLFIQDGAQLDFSGRQANGLGRISMVPYGQGLILHTTLAVQAEETPVILGLAHQDVWIREGTPNKQRNETADERYLREGRESAHWADSLAAIGPVPEGACWISVGDRASDVFRYWSQARDLGWECLLRFAQDRKIRQEDNSMGHLKQWVRSLAVMATDTLELRARPDQPARAATLSLAWASTQVLPPERDPTQRDLSPLEVWGLHVWEVSSPDGEEPLEWLLLSTLPIHDEQEARETVKWYRHRWLIEQYHKALKTDCRMEAAQLKDGEALKRLLGFLSIAAVRLLQLETLARTIPDLPADRAVDPEFMQFVCRLRQLDPAHVTVYQFWREVAKCGGFLGRKSDGEPGWQTLWKGWNYLYPRFEGYLIGKSCG